MRLSLPHVPSLKDLRPLTMKRRSVLLTDKKWRSQRGRGRAIPLGDFPAKSLGRGDGHPEARPGPAMGPPEEASRGAWSACLCLSLPGLLSQNCSLGGSSSRHLFLTALEARRSETKVDLRGRTRVLAGRWLLSWCTVTRLFLGAWGERGSSLASLLLRTLIWSSVTV